MKLRIFLEIFFKLVLISVSFSSVNPGILENHARLITKVFHQKKESTITIFHYSDSDNSREKHYLFRITRLLSKSRILSTTVDFRKWNIVKQYYWEKHKENSRGRRPMIVALLSNQGSLDQFKKIYKDLDFEEHLFCLLLFIKTDKEYLREICVNPDGRFLQLRFDSLMVVKCYDDNRLRAWYTLDGENIKISNWAIWDPTMEFLTMIVDNNHLKINLEGRELRIATVDSSALTAWTEEGKLVGYFGQLLEELQYSMNFTWKLIKKETGYGSWNVTDNYWTGGTNLLYKHKIDLLVTDLALTSLRMTAIDYTIPILNVNSMLYVKKPHPGTVIKWFAHFTFFDFRIWLVIILIIMIAPLMLTILTIKTEKSHIFSPLLLENYITVFGIYCQQGLIEFPTATSVRLVYSSIFFSALIILNFYSAFLLSRLTYPIPDVFMPDMEAFIKDRSYKLITLKNGADYNIFEFGKTDTLKAMFQLMLKVDDLPESVQAGFDMVCEQKVGLFIVATARFIKDLDIKCNLHEVRTSLNEISTMALPKYSQYKREINRNFFRYTVNGMLGRFYKHYFYLKPVEDENESQVTIGEIAVLLAIVGGGIILSIITLLMEKIVFSKKITKVKKAEVQKVNSFEHLTKWFKFDNEEQNRDLYNLHGEANIKFIRNDRNHKIESNSGVNRISFAL